MGKSAFFVYRASAGSGKTFSLAVSYIRICLKYFNENQNIFQKILCITFTNKAVNEMKTRILHFLEVLSEKNDTEEKQKLSKNFRDICPDCEITKRSEIILKNILTEYSRFSVLTIDKFYQRILNTFAFELQIPSGHQLELDVSVFTQQLVDVMLSKLGYDQTLTGFVLKYLYQRLEEGRNWKIESSLAETAVQLYRESACPFLEEIKNFSPDDFSSLIKKMYEEVNRLDNQVKKKANSALKILDEIGINPLDLYYAKSGIGGWFVKVANSGVAETSYGSHVKAAIEKDKFIVSDKSEIVQKVKSVSPDLKRIFYEINDFADRHISDYCLYKNMIRKSYPFALLNEFKKVADEIRETTHQILISETNQYISKIIESEDVPFIYSRLGERFSFFFIDEFQDTSCLQWKNILPLIEEGLSKSCVDNGNTDETGQAYIFGDAKQAIYRFRNGDVRQFIRICNLDTHNVEGPEKSLKAYFKLENKQFNFRSKKELVDFNNAYFRYRSDKNEENDEINKAYNNLEQKLPEINEDKIGGGVRYKFMASDSEIPFNEYVTCQVRKIITECLNDKYTYSDIAVLTRSNALSSMIAGNLTDIPMISSDSLLLVHSEEVGFLVSCLNCLKFPDSDVSRAEVLYYLSLRQNPDTVSLSKVFESAKAFETFCRSLDELNYHIDFKALKCKNLYEKIEFLISVFNLSPIDPFIMSFEEIVWAYHEDYLKNDEDFLTYWDEQKDSFSLSNPEGFNAVHVMSIHRSKGLEFPIVIYPMERDRNHSMPDRWIRLNKPVENGKVSLNVALVNLKIDEIGRTEYSDYVNEERNLRVLDSLNVEYVAFTRAKDRLYLIERQDKKEISEVEGFFTEFCGIKADSEENGVKSYSYPESSKFSVNKRKENKDEISPEFLEFKKRMNLPDLSLIESGKDYTLEKGIIVHYYLSMIYTFEDIDYVRKLLLKDNEISSGDKSFVEKLLFNLKNNPEAKILFGDREDKVKTEVEIVSSEAGLYRIDRLLLRGKQCRLFDYKTGGADPDNIRQIRKYADLLEQAGYVGMSAYLVYFSESADITFKRVI